MTPPVIIYREILIGESLLTVTPAVDELLAGKIDHAYFESSADNIKLQKIMK